MLRMYLNLQIGIAVVAALVVLMICTMFGLWYNNRKYVNSVGLIQYIKVLETRDQGWIINLFVLLPQA